MLEFGYQSQSNPRGAESSSRRLLRLLLLKLRGFGLLLLVVILRQPLLVLGLGGLARLHAPRKEPTNTSHTLKRQLSPFQIRFLGVSQGRIARFGPL